MMPKGGEQKESSKGGAELSDSGCGYMLPEAGSTDEMQKSRHSVASLHGELNDAPLKSSKSYFLEPMKVFLHSPLCRYDPVKDLEKGRLPHINCTD